MKQAVRLKGQHSSGNLRNKEAQTGGKVTQAKTGPLPNYSQVFIYLWALILQDVNVNS